MVRLAIVGVGGYGWDLLRVIRDVADDAGCEVVAAADARWEAIPERARELRELGIELFDEALGMFDALQGHCDAVYIATGIHTHCPLTLAALNAGYHVHLEKPPAATVQEVDAMTDAARERERCCLVGFQAVHGPDIRGIEDRIVSGRLGAVRSLTCRAAWSRKQSYYDRAPWAGSLRQGDAWVLDGPAMNALAHQTTNMLLLSSPEAGGYATPTCVRAELYRAQDITSNDTAAIEIETAEGPVLRFLASHVTQEYWGPTTEAVAEKGSVTWTMGKGFTVRYEDGAEESFQSQGDMGRPEMVQNFVEAVRANDPSLLRCSVEDTRAFILALDGAYESSRRIHRIPGARILDEGTPEQRAVVDGLDALIARCAAERCLFSDLADAPSWAVRTEPFDLTDYTSFPQQFEE